MTILRKAMLGIVGLVVGLFVITVAVLYLAPTFGGTITDARRMRVEASPRYKNGRFENAVPEAKRQAGEAWDMAKRQFSGNEMRYPPRPIPVLPMSTQGFERSPPPGLRAIWFGHASVYLELDGLRLFVDPMLSSYATPIAGIGPRRFHPPPLDLEALPRIDVVLISHDHYDHLDMRTVKHLASKGTHFVLPLGVGAHLDRWGVPAAQVSELDWWQSHSFGGVTFTSTPVRHYSGRALRDGNATLWSSWVMAGQAHRVFFSGDTGAGDHFQTIGDRHGPFDLSLIKIGAYGPSQTWIDIHMTPEAAVLAHMALRGKRLLPVHWGTFNLAFHAWDEPIERAVAAAKGLGAEIVTPRVGEVVTAGQPFISEAWWK